MDLLFVALFFFLWSIIRTYIGSVVVSVHGGWSVLAWHGLKCLEGRDGARLEELESVSCSRSCSVSRGTVQLDVICTCSTFQSVSIAYQFVGCPG